MLRLRPQDARDRTSDKPIPTEQFITGMKRSGCPPSCEIYFSVTWYPPPVLTKLLLFFLCITLSVKGNSVMAKAERGAEERSVEERAVAHTRLWI